MATHFKQIMLIVLTLLLVILVNPNAQAEMIVGDGPPSASNKSEFFGILDTQATNDKSNTTNILSEPLDVSGAWLSGGGISNLLLHNPEIP